MKRQGFTLIELLITIAIIGILAGAATTAYIGVLKKAARSEAYTNLDALRLLQEGFFSDRAVYAPPPEPGPVTVTGTAAIQAFLPGFRPDPNSNFIYAITQETDVGLPTPVPVPYAGTTASLPGTTTRCFRAIATGTPNSRVAGDVFAIDCNNNKNY